MILQRVFVRSAHRNFQQQQFARKLTGKTAQEAATSILYETPLQNSQPPTFKRHILSALVTDEPGVLSRVSGALAGRGFNIESLVVCSTDVQELSRMTIVIRVENKQQSTSKISALAQGDSVVEQARKQLESQVAVWGVLDYTDVTLIERELLLLKVDLSALQDGNDRETKRQSLISLTALFGGRVVDIHPTQMILELSAKKSRVDAFLGVVNQADVGDVKEVVRSGLVAIPRTVIQQEEKRSLYEQEEDEGVDVSQLPPG